MPPDDLGDDTILDANIVAGKADSLPSRGKTVEIY